MLFGLSSGRNGLMVKDQVVTAKFSHTFSRCSLLRASCCSFGRSSFQTHVIQTSVVFTLFDHCFFSFWLSTYFWVPQPKDGKNQLESQTQNFMLNLLRKKFINKIKYYRSSSDPDFIGITINSHVIYFQFLPFSRLFWRTQEN